VRAALPRRVSDPIFQAFLRRRAVRRSIEDFEAREIEREFCGHRLRICVEDPVAEWWYGDGWPLLPEIAELRRRGLRPGALVFNAGMHQGVLAMVLARIVGPDGRVVGAEPEPHNVRVARRNLARNGVDNVEIVQAAVADKPGTLFFEENIGGRVVGASRGSIEVQAVTIDELAALHGEPDVVFVDVEGAEGSVVAGAARTLGQGRATWFVEVHQGLGLEPPGWPDPAEVVAAFSPDRFEVLVAVEGATYGDEHVFEPLRSSLPDGRFFMIATPVADAGGRPRTIVGACRQSSSPAV
jgi:FkbM family methyltransferase